MKIDKLKVGRVSVVASHGALTQLEVEEFVAAIEEMRVLSAGRMVLDMRAVPYADSQALEALLDFADHQHSVGQNAKLAGLTETCREVMGLTDLVEEFEVFDTVDSAVRSFL